MYSDRGALSLRGMLILPAVTVAGGAPTGGAPPRGRSGGLKNSKCLSMSSGEQAV